MSRHKCICVGLEGGGGGGFNSCVISPFKFHKQLNILCAFCAFLLSRGKTMKIGRETSGEREREKKFLLEISAIAHAWPSYTAAQGALRVGASSSTPPNNYGFIVIML